MANTQQQQIDAYLGPGWFQEWQDMEGQAKELQLRYFGSLGRLASLRTPHLTDRIGKDMGLLAKIGSDYRQGLTMIAFDRKIDRREIARVHDLYTLALGVARSENDALDTLWISGFIAAWAVFPFSLLQARAERLRLLLEPAKEELRKAEREVTEVWLKLAIHGVLATFEALNPELSLLSRGAVVIIDVVADKALGGETSRAKAAAGVGAPVVKQFGEAIHHMESLSERTRSVAGKAGKGATAVTFYLDVDELSHAYAHADHIRNALTQAKRAYDDLVLVIEKHRDKLKALEAAFARWMRKIEDSRSNAAYERAALFEDIRQYAYPVDAAKPWMVLGR